MSKFDGTRPGPGRPKGSKNKLGQLARENIAAVFDNAGGIQAMVEWARENRTEFYARVYTRLLPSDAHVTAEVRRALVDLTDDELMMVATGQTACDDDNEPEDDDAG